MNIEKVNELLQLSDDIIEFIKQDRFLREEKNNLNILENAKSNLKDRRFVVSVIAAMKAGKSTTFNALIGRDILPNETEACTTAITEIKHSNQPSEYITKVYNDGSLEKITGGNGKTIEQNFHEDVRESRKNDKVKDIKKYYFEIPIKAIEGSEYKDLVQNFILVDTPGPNEANIGDFDVSILQKIALEQLRNSDALIMLLDYQNYKSDVNAKIIKDIFENRDDLSKDQGKIYFLINKIDSMTSKDGTIEQVIDNVKKLILEYAPVIKEPKVFAFSAKQACLSRIVMSGNASDEIREQVISDYGSEYRTKINVKGKELTVIPEPEEFAEQLLEKSKITFIEKQIIENMFNSASEKMICSAFERLEKAVNNILNNANTQIEISSKESNELVRIVNEGKKDILNLIEEGNKISQIPTRHLETLKSQVNSILSQIPNNIKQVVTQCMPSENIIESDDKKFLNQRIDMIKSNTFNNIQVAINREVDRIQRLSIDSQVKINEELNNAFYNLSDKANKLIGSKLSLKFQVFSMDEISESKFADIAVDADEKQVSEEIGKIKEFDGKGAGFGVAAGITAGSAAGAAIGSVVPIIGTAIGGAIGAGIGGIAGFFLGGSKEHTQVEKKQIYTIDITELKKQLVLNSENAVANAIDQINSTTDQIIKQYIDFTHNQLNVFIGNLDQQLNKIMKDYEGNKETKEDHINHMNNIKSVAIKFLQEIDKIKNN